MKKKMRSSSKKRFRDSLYIVDRIVSNLKRIYPLSKIKGMNKSYLVKQKKSLTTTFSEYETKEKKEENDNMKYFQMLKTYGEHDSFLIGKYNFPFIKI